MGESNMYICGLGKETREWAMRNGLVSNKEWEKQNQAEFDLGKILCGMLELLPGKKYARRPFC